MKQPTMQEIADQLKLSRMTVSTVINKRQSMRYVNDKTKARIDDYLNEIGYVRNFHAMGLKRPKRDVLGVYYDGTFIVHHITDAFNRFIQMNQANSKLMIEVKMAPLEKCELAIEELIGRGATKLVWFMEQDKGNFNQERVLKFLGHCNSVIYNSPTRKDFIESAGKYKNIGLIHFKRQEGMAKIGKKLFDLGHRKVAIPYLKASDPLVSAGYLKLENQGLKSFYIYPENIPYKEVGKYEGFLAEIVIESMKRDGITAAVFGDDALAAETMIALIDRGVRIPEEIAITGMDGEPWLKYLQKPIETVAFPIDRALKLIQGILFEKKKAGEFALGMELMPGKSMISVDQMNLR